MQVSQAVKALDAKLKHQSGLCSSNYDDLHPQAVGFMSRVLLSERLRRASEQAAKVYEALH